MIQLNVNARNKEDLHKMRDQVMEQLEGQLGDEREPLNGKKDKKQSKA